MPGERESFCQRSVNFRNTWSIGSYRQPIPGERRFCDTLPSKQAVAGSSPVSRSTSSTVALEVLHKPLDRKRAVMANRDGGFLLPQKVFNGHLPSFSGNYLPRLALADKSVRNLT
jgi:hypothetical protein